MACRTRAAVTPWTASRNANDLDAAARQFETVFTEVVDLVADGQAVGDATGREWRTPPLWGIGLTQEVSGHSFFLHDGRARNLTEAILWHGGEAEAARDAFAAAKPEDRKALITFLESL